MTMLQTMLKPHVIFDPANAEHRLWAASYIKNKTWRDCPVRFIVNDNSLDLPGVIQRQLIEFYVSTEFDK